MNIKEAIERGLYPKDDKGRALVPTSSGLVTIYATDHTDSYPLVGSFLGHLMSWTAEGWSRSQAPSDSDLLPPPPRKEIIRAWAVRGATHIIDHFHDEEKAHAYAAMFKSKHGAATVIELTGEYEEPWS